MLPHLTVSAQCGYACTNRFGPDVCQQIRPVCVGPPRAALQLTRALDALPADATSHQIVRMAQLYRDWQ